MGNMSGSYGNHYTLWQSITVNSQNVANNKSNITVKMYLSFDGSSYYSYTNNTTSGTMIIEGSTYNYSISSINFSSGQAKDILLATWTGDIAHNTDGTKSLSVSGSWNTDTSRIGSGSCSVSKVLSTIPRASSISCSTANIEENAVITINSSSNSFTHKVIAYFGDETVTVATEKAGGTFQWTIPSSFYAQIPNSKTGVGTLTCETYASETLIGSKSIVLNITTSESKCRPTVTATVEDTNSATVALTGDSSKLIKYKSTAYVKVTPVAKNSATIKSTTVRNVTVTNNEISFANFSGSAFKVVTTDSRGYTNSEYILTPTIIQYIPLTLNATFFRPQPTTGEVQLTYSGNYFNGSFGYVSNEISFTWKYRKQGTSEWTTGGTITPTISGNTVKQTTISLGKEFDYQTAYDFQLVAVDKLTTLTITAKVSMGLPVFYWGKDFIYMNGEIIKNNGYLPVFRGYTTDFNTALTHGFYAFASTDITGSPITGTVYGTLEVIVQQSKTWDYSNLGLYIWQIYRDTEGREFQRYGVNSETMSEWQRVYHENVLYDNSSGTAGTVTWSKSIANSSYIEIYYGTINKGTIYCNKIYSPNGTKGRLLHCGSTHLFHKDITINKTSISVEGYRSIQVSDGTNDTTANSIYIYKVVSYR